ncbi:MULTISPECIES: ABC transporter ATP-binding protein [Mesorhizobium]|uniref:ABC transporter ATP-binding protein n=1 Tax=Mesorhizobium denitrificans TaxID=2294114 RepID=A0A371X8Z1_9HYPH|nr:MULTISPECIES: ABC transporter ATP-binding protein [Mesorhizobium]RFC65660.1 ABC transporter ATP-binding protein [Mesorhizobium denitrificans]
MSDQIPVLVLSGITKTFGKTVANSSVSLEVKRGEIVGLLGENGAGKTTLMNILFGLYRADEGKVFVEGNEVNIATTADAISLGIGMVQQHSHAVSRHTVLENLMLGLPGKNGFLDRAFALNRLKEIADGYGLRLDPSRVVSTLAVGERQRLDIIRALFRRARVLILDEPTSVLTPQETEGLFSALRSLQADGVGIIFISHKLNEVMAITDRIVVMRRGKVVADVVNDKTVTSVTLATMMCGHEPDRVQRIPHTRGDACLVASEVVLQRDEAKKAAHKINLTIHSGEILGVAGVSGNGQVALAETIAGVARAAHGSISIDGDIIENPSPRRMQQAGLSYIPEDRIGAGFVSTMPLKDNMVLSRFSYPPFSRAGWIDWGKVLSFAESQIAEYDVRPPDPQMPVGLMSGGNQQKAIVARELAFSPRVLIIAQPTRGLDVSAIAFVQRSLITLRDAGCSIMLISDDLDEIFQLSDRIAVMYEGSIIWETPIEQATVASVGLAMNGSNPALTEARA